MRLSVMPSLKYSVLGSALPLVKGNTANESIASPPVRVTANHFANASSAAKREWASFQNCLVAPRLIHHIHPATTQLL